MSKTGRPPESAQSLIKHFQTRPVEWLDKTFNVKLWERQEEIINSVWNNRYTVCKSCFSSGKSYLAAALVEAWLHLWPGSIVLTTAPSSRQVRNVWQNVHIIHEQARGPLGSDLLQQELRCGPGWYGFGFSTDDPDLIQGVHASSGRILLIVDESAAVEQKLHTRLTSALMTSERAHRLDIGNPLDPAGPFFDMFTDPKYQKFTISAFDTPNVKNNEIIVPGLVTRTWVNERRDEWGEESPLWKSQVLGQFPETSENSLIPMRWVRLAQERWNELEPDDYLVYGVDPGGGGLAETSLCTRAGQYVFPIRAAAGLSSPQIVGTIKDHCSSVFTAYVDAIGVGFGVVGHASENGLNVQGVNVQTQSSDPKRYLNLRAELYWRLREQLDPSNPNAWGLPEDEVLAGQLTSIRWKIADSGGKIQVESKQEMRRRGLPSPDRADSLMLTCMDLASSKGSAFGVGVGTSDWSRDLAGEELMAIESGWGSI